MGFNYERANKTHDNFYDYSRVVYTKAKDKVEIGCPKHGYFWQTPDTHYKSGCKDCGLEKLNLAKFIDKDKYFKTCNLKHNNFYGYSKTVFEKLSDKIVIDCPIHGEFTQKASDHYAGKGCKKCGIESGKINSRIPISEQIEEFNKVHNNFYTYPNLTWKNRIDSIDIICPVHGEFQQKAINHSKGHGCKKCAKEKTSKALQYNLEDVINKANIVHNFKYTYPRAIYKDSKSKITITCEKHGDFKQKVNNHLSGKGCSKCIENCSKKENVLYEFLSEYFETEQSNRSILGRQELDIVIHSKKLAIEYNGLYWHSDKFVKNNYHLNKTEKANKKGFDLIHVFDDEWLDKEEVVKAKILSYLDIYQNIVNSDSCEIKEVKDENLQNFLIRNSLESGIKGKQQLGLYNGEDLVQVLIANDNKLQGIFTKINTKVEGEKLFEYYSKDFQSIEVIIDRRWLDDKHYLSLGFKKVEDYKPNYFYCYGEKRYTKRPDKKEVNKIYDCGKSLLIL